MSWCARSGEDRGWSLGRGRGSLRAWSAAVAGVVSIVACSGGDDAEQSTRSAAVAEVSSAVASTAVSNSESSSSGTEPTATPIVSANHQSVMRSLGAALEPDLDGTVLPVPDEACFARLIDRGDAIGEDEIDELEADPAAWSLLGPQARFQLASAYVGCGDLEETRAILAVVLTGSVERVACLAEAWRGVLTAEAIVSSVAFGHGLDDLPPDTVEAMTSGVIGCLPDQNWWIDDIAVKLDGASSFDWSSEEARCVAERYVSTLGLEPAIQRRVLTIPMLAVSAEQMAVLDLPAACGTDIAVLPAQSAAVPGDCIASMGTANEAVVACAGPHGAEVVSVGDLGAAFGQWPGIAVLQETAARSCAGDAEIALQGVDGFDTVWAYPSRMLWEQGVRRLTCLIRRQDGAEWTGPSGAVIAVTTTTTAAPSSGTLVDLNSLQVGQCLRGAGLVDGDLGDGVIEVVDCAVPHHAEVFHVSSMDDPAGTPYPGDEVAKNTALGRCHPDFDSYVGQVWAESRLGFTYLYPFDVDWDANNRLVLCYLWDRLGRMLTGSMAGSGQ